MAAARALVGTPFRHQGRTAYGLDCIGLIILARHTLAPWGGMQTAADYQHNPNGKLLEIFPRFATPIDEPEEGAVAVMVWPMQKHASHVGIVTPTTIIHAYAAARRVVETGYREPWVRRTVSLWRVEGVTP